MPYDNWLLSIWYTLNKLFIFNLLRKDWLILYRTLVPRGNDHCLLHPRWLSCGIHQLILSRVLRRSLNKCSGYDTKESDNEAPVMLKLWRMQSTCSLPSLSGLLWFRVVASDRVRSMGWIEEFDIKTLCKQIEHFDHLTLCKKNDWCLIELFVIHSNTWSYSTLLTYVHICLIYMNKPDLALNNSQCLICLRTKSNVL